MNKTSHLSSSIEMYEWLEWEMSSIQEVQDFIEWIVEKYINNLGIKQVSTSDFIHNLYWNSFLTSCDKVSQQLRLVIKRALNSFFKWWLKNNETIETDSTKKMTLKLCSPSNKVLSEINNWTILWAIGISIATELQPRYIKDGDKAIYNFVFELRIIKTPEDHHHNYQFPARKLSKSDIKTEQRDASIQRSADAHRIKLMKIVSGWLPWLGK